MPRFFLLFFIIHNEIIFTAISKMTQPVVGACYRFCYPFKSADITMIKTTEHDKTAVRLTEILKKLNEGEKLDPK